MILEEEEQKVKARTRPFAPSTSQVLLTGHVIPNAVHLLGRDLVHRDDPPVPAQAVGHLPVIKARVLERVDAQLPQTQPHVHVLQVQQSGVLRRNHHF